MTDNFLSIIEGDPLENSTYRAMLELDLKLVNSIRVKRGESPLTLREYHEQKLVAFRALQELNIFALETGIAGEKIQPGNVVGFDPATNRFYLLPHNPNQLIPMGVAVDSADVGDSFNYTHISNQKDGA